MTTKLTHYAVDTKAEQPYTFCGLPRQIDTPVSGQWDYVNCGGCLQRHARAAASNRRPRQDRKLVNHFNLGSFALGLVFGIAGVILAYTMALHHSSEEERGEYKSASWWGFGFSLILWTVLIIWMVNFIGKQY